MIMVTGPSFSNSTAIMAPNSPLQIVEQFPYSYMADAALMHAASIEQSHLKNKELAKQHYEKLIDEYPTSIYTAQAKKNYRKL